MVFSGITFIYLFLPCVLILYFIFPNKLKNSVLLISGLVFYAWGEPKYVFVMIASIVFNFFCGIFIDKARGKPLSKIVFITSIAVNLFSLGYFKYADFFIENFNRAFGLDIRLLRIALPVGISFYTFQILSYIIDLYKEKICVQKNIINLGAYIVMFPQLIAGPIVRYSVINNSLIARKHSISKSAEGIRRFICGLSKKVIIADSLGKLCADLKEFDEKSVFYYWLYAVVFSFQIYFDFSGYSDMAIGLGKFFGFDFPENFNYPYISKTVTEFWRRWHMMLGQWFRDYLYFPLGGSRTSKIKIIRNLAIVWLATGFWHGAEWNFIIWGGYFGVLLIIEKLWLYKYIDRFKIISRIYLLLIVVIGFVIFNTENLNELFAYLKKMLCLGNIDIFDSGSIYYFKSYFVLLAIAVLGSTPLPKTIMKKVCQYKAMTIIEPVVISMLLIITTAFIVDSNFSPFLYFRF